VPGGSFKSRNLEGYTTATNVSLRERLGTDGIMANDTYSFFRAGMISILAARSAG
jgi:hypothetical protein